MSVENQDNNTDKGRVPAQNVVSSVGIPSGPLDDFDSLVPENMRNALKELEEPEEPVVDKDTPVLKTESQEEENEDLEPLNLSEDAFDKLLKGDPNALTAIEEESSEENQEEVSFWHENEDYKQFLFDTRIQQEEIDPIIKKVVETKLEENKEYVSSLQKEVDNFKTTQDTLKLEIDRLRTVERQALFDSTKEIQDKYLVPINNARKEIDKIAKFEGLNVSVDDILKAEDKTQLTAVLEEFDLDSVTRTKLTNHWVNYKNLAYEYLEEKERAKTSLGKALGTSIPEETSNRLFKQVVPGLFQKDEDGRFAYLRKAIEEGFEAHPEAGRVFANAKTNFDTFVNAISEAYDHSRNHEFIAGLGEFFIKASDDEYKASQASKYLNNYNELAKKYMTLAKKYDSLSQSARGKIGRSGFPVKKDGVNVHSEQTEEELLQEYQDLLKEKTDINRLLGNK